MQSDFEKLAALTDPDDILEFVRVAAKAEPAIPNNPDHERAYGLGCVAAVLACQNRRLKDLTNPT